MKDKKKIVIISAFGAAILAVVLISIFVCFHSWADATCTTPMTCKKCGKTKGQALSHEWIEATCKEPKHCLRCGLTEGSSLEHTFIEATCETAKKCSVCGFVEGDPLGHKVSNWKITKATSCSAKGERIGICARCKKECIENIDMLPHTKSEWQVKKNFIINSDGNVAAGTEAVFCTVCKQEIETREYTTKLTASQKNAAISAYDEVNFWHCGPSFLIYNVLSDFGSYPLEDAKFVVAHINVDYNEQAVLYAQEHYRGSSKDKLIEEMTYYGFTNSQISQALNKVGY